MRWRALIPALLLAAGLVAASVPGSQEDRPALWPLLERALELRGGQAELETLLEHMAGIPTRHRTVAHRLSLVERALTEPWTSSTKPPIRRAS